MNAALLRTLVAMSDNTQTAYLLTQDAELRAELIRLRDVVNKLIGAVVKPRVTIVEDAS